ncbi:MAG TPA: bifunctional DNA-formamidopyrimidine glycosylase/DNA-(apurinic or apyrimidinic site) lyase [Candidatus Binatia bacterium]|nr:bifunctional DNA-formamidopyrimidine glycosylase/DNA-(apurinic or apyrimidinic site) lyase [Candidatus Binatia bacterium]
MPELPEVETVARDLRAELAGRRFVSAWVHRPGVLRFPVDEVFTATLPGHHVESVARWGKYIFCRLDGGEDLVFHLGMTGHLRVVQPSFDAARHTHLRAGLDDGRELRFDDARRFGRVLLGPRAVLEERRLLPVLGVEPLSDDFTSASLDLVLRRTTRTVKAALLDQSGVAGLGNIYVDEACHLAGIRPTRRAHRLTRRERAALHAAIRAVLVKAVGNRGTSFDDYRDLWDARGANQEALQVYGRGGAPCFRCGAVLRRTVVASRTTVYCPGCQR